LNDNKRSEDETAGILITDDDGKTNDLRRRNVKRNVILLQWSSGFKLHLLSLQHGTVVRIQRKSLSYIVEIGTISSNLAQNVFRLKPLLYR
jgi:hypothetical protein